MCINKVEVTDMPVLQLISQRCLTDSVQLDDQLRKELIAHTAKNINDYIGANTSDFLKYVDQNRIVGYILIKDHWNLSDLFVMPTEQGRGIGTKLLNFAIASAKRSSKKDYVWVNSSENAEGFYRNRGFTSRIVEGRRMPGVVPLELVL